MVIGRGLPIGGSSGESVRMAVRCGETVAEHEAELGERVSRHGKPHPTARSETLRAIGIPPPAGARSMSRPGPPGSPRRPFRGSLGRSRHRGHRLQSFRIPATADPPAEAGWIRFDPLYGNIDVPTGHRMIVPLARYSGIWPPPGCPAIFGLRHFTLRFAARIPVNQPHEPKRFSRTAAITNPQGRPLIILDDGTRSWKRRTRGQDRPPAQVPPVHHPSVGAGPRPMPETPTQRPTIALGGLSPGACAVENTTAAETAYKLPETRFFCVISHFSALPRAKFDRKRDIPFNESSCGAGS